MMTLRFLACLILGSSGTLRAAAPNDAFDNAIDLGSVAEWSAVVDAAAATVQVGEPAHPGFFSDSGSLWWKWTAPAGGGELELVTGNGVAMHLYQRGQLGELVRIDSAAGLPANRRPVTAGATYRVMAGGSGTSTRAGFVFHPRPANDDFANATDLGTAFPRTVTARNDAATREAGEPAHWTPHEGGSRWWSWTAPADGVVSLDFPDAPFSSWVLAAYRGAEISGLTLVNRVFSQTASGTSFRISGGETLRLALAHGTGAHRGSTTFRIDMRELVNNDSPENALDLGVTGSASFTGDTTAASPDPDAGSTPAIWWRWSPPVNGRVSIGFAEPGTSGNLGLFRLLPDGGRQAVATHYHPIRKYCRADESYLIRLEANPGNTPLVIELSHTSAPANDDLADALPLPFSRTEIDLTNAGAEPGEPFNDAARSVWWKWTAPADGALLAKGNLFEDSAQYTTTPADLIPVADAPQASDRRAVSAGQGYFFANHVVSSNDPPLVETIDPVFVPLTSGNGAFADSASLGDSAHGRAFADMADAVREPGEPEPAEASLWWRWTAPFDGILAVELNDWESVFSDPMSQVRLFTGSSAEALTSTDPPPGWSSFNKIRAFTVSGGTTYHLRFIAIPGLFDFRYDAFPLPHANDAFAAAADLGSVTSHEGTLVFSGATQEAGEPVHDPSGVPATASRWWSWTAPAEMTVDLSGPVAAVYRGDSLATLQAVGTDLLISGDKSHRFPAVVGTTYRIALVGRDGRPTFRLHARPSPAGDRFASPEELGDVVRAELTSDLTDHTFERGEPEPVYAGGTSRWWHWTAPRDGTVSVVDFSGNWSLVTGSELATASTIAGTTDIPVAAGQSLRIRLHGGSGSSQRILAFHPYKPNDDFADAANLGAAESTSVTIDPYHATTEAAEPPAFPGHSAPGTLWWTWTAPADGILALATEAETQIHSPLSAGLYEGDSLDSLTPARDSIYRPGHFAVLSGRTYRIRLAAATPRQSAPVTLDLAFLPGVPNDHWLRATDLGQTASARGSGTLVGTTPEWFSPTASQAGTAWWKWTAPADGTAFIHVDTSKGARDLLVFDDPASGVPLALHQVVDLNLSGPAFALPVSAGKSLWISVGTRFDSLQGPVDLVVNHLARPNNETPENAAPVFLDSPVTASFLGTIPGDESNPILWWNWTAPADGLYELAVDPGAASVFAETAPGEWSFVTEAMNGVLIWRADAGVSYRIATAAPAGAWPDVSLTLTATAPAPNDHFAYAAALSGDVLEIRSHLVDATAETGEPDHGGTPAVRSVWFSWTAPATTHLSLRLEATQARLAIYTGDAPGSLVPLANGTGEVRLPVTQGETYRIAVDGGAAEAFSLALRTYFPPSNDRLADRIVLSSAAPTFTGDLEFATTEPGEPTAVSASLWWEWTSPASGAFDLIGGGSAQVFTGATLSFLRPVTMTTPATGVRRFEAAAGITYIIGFSGGTNMQQANRAELELRPARPLPSNDRFADAIALGGESATSASHNWGAGVDPGEPANHTRSLWWTWTAPRDGSARVSTIGGNLHIYRGDSITALTPAGNPFSGVALYPVFAGDTFRLAVNAIHQPGEVSLTVEMTPPGDDFHAALILPSFAPEPATIDLFKMGWEPLEPPHDGKPAERSAWFRWTAPDSTPVTFELTRSSGIRVAVYTGDALTRLTPVAEAEGAVTFLPRRGETYHIAVDQTIGYPVGLVTLGVSQQLTGFAAWRASRFPDPNAAAAEPDADPDQDGRVNLLEMALGTDPLASDAAPGAIRIRDFGGYVTVSVIRPASHGGLAYALEVTPGLGQPWQNAETMNHVTWTIPLDDGMEEFHIQLVGVETAAHPEYFARLRVTIE